VLWVTENVSPAMVIVPDRWIPEFAAAAIITEPLPGPGEPPAKEIQLSDVVAIQPHPGWVVTFTLMEPPPALKYSLPGPIVNVQVAVPSWFTVITCPPTAIEAVR
jgi:hypothetical protein